MKRFLHDLQGPVSVLEVGIDRGVSFCTLLAFLARVKPSFFALGVDILVQEQVKIMVQNLDFTPQQQVFLREENSLTLLPKLAEQGLKFDLLLLDGDHNYHTVSNELKLLDDLVLPHGIVIIDDYDGRWSDKDLWYANRPGYENVSIATQKVDSEKHGVKPAVDEFLSSNTQWRMEKPIATGEPVLLHRAA